MALEPKELASIPIEYYAQLTGAWTTFDTAAFAALDELHVWNESFKEQRLKWRSAQPVTILEVRCWRLRTPLLVPSREEYFGCFSWVDVAGSFEAAAVLDGSSPALSHSEFGERQALLRSRLADIEVQELVL